LAMVLLIAQLRNVVADTQSNGFVTHSCPAPLEFQLRSNGVLNPKP